MADKFPDHETSLVRSWVELNSSKTSGYFSVFLFIGHGVCIGSNVGIDPTWAISRAGSRSMLTMSRLMVEVSREEN